MAASPERDRDVLGSRLSSGSRHSRPGRRAAVFVGRRGGVLSGKYTQDERLHVSGRGEQVIRRCAMRSPAEQFSSTGICQDMRIDAFIWSEERTEHIAQHGVTPEEVEEVCFRNSFVRRAKSEGDNPVYYVLGQTEAGRYLFCVVIRFPDGNGYPVTA